MKTHLHFQRLSSTNIYMRELVKKYPATQMRALFPPFFAVTANEQENGHGRQGKKWESETGKNLLLSLLLYPNVPPSKQFNICQYVSIAAADVIRDTFSVPDVSIKWPNDIYVRDKKISGILIEHFIQGESINYSIVGIGININQRTFPASLPPTTSLLLETGKEHEIKTCMENLIEKMKQTEQLSDAALKMRYEHCLYRKGKFACFVLPAISATPMLLQITGVDEIGRLQLVDKNNIPYSCAFNEIVYCLSVDD
ncbi:MAG: biotin--[acetyl-CoA-carboxylase] ligase [Bacteroidales bacterium]|nr:biotin--[acetyl-CoA-carboxylase] ligase [Bacteroidales bacterium]